MNELTYNNLGIKNPVAFDYNPKSNRGLVYQTANSPDNSGALLPGQSIADLTFVSGYSQRRIRITMNPGNNPEQTPGSIAIIDENNNIIASLGEVGVIGSGLQGAPLFIRVFQDTNAINVFGTAPGSNNAMVNILQLEPNSNSVPLVIGQNGRNTEPFYRVQELKSAGRTINFYVSDDASDPNGILTGRLGDICFGVGGGAPSYCAADLSTTWIQLL